MLKKFSLKSQFKLLLFPVIILTTILVIFISYSEYKKSGNIEALKNNINIIEDIRKLTSLISKEREISISTTIENSEFLKSRILKDLKKKRSINNTRVKSLSKKIDFYSKEEIEKSFFLQSVIENIKYIQNKINPLRLAIDNNSLTKREIVKSYSLIIEKLISSIATSSLEIDNPAISKNVTIYSIYINYLDATHRRDILVKDFLITHKLDRKLELDIHKIYTKLSVVSEIGKSLVNRSLCSFYNSIIYSKEITDVEDITLAIIENRIEDTENIKIEYYQNLLKKFNKKMKELDDYISRNISEELNLIADKNEKRVALLEIIFLVSLLFIMITTYFVYNNLRDIMFFGTLKIRGKILRIMSDIPNFYEDKDKNEISSLIYIVSKFVKALKKALLNIRSSYRNIVGLSNNLSESSEKIINHVQEQSHYLENVNFQMEIFLDSLQNSEISFNNLKEIIDDSSEKITDLNLDVVRISDEVKILNRLNINIENNIKYLENVIVGIVSTLENGNQDSEINGQITILNSFSNIINLLNEQNIIIMQKSEKLVNISNIASVIKHDAEINNANLSDILGVITILGFETKSIAVDIDNIFKKNNVFIKTSKDMVGKSKYLSSNVKILNKSILDLDKEFNKFSF